MNQLRLALVITLAVLPVVAAAQSRELYKCKSDHGETSFQDQPCATKARTEGVIPIQQYAAPEISHQTVTLNFRHIELAKVIKILAQVGNVNLQLDPRSDMFVDVTVVDTPWDDVLQNLLPRYGLRLQVVNGVGYIH